MNIKKRNYSVDVFRYICALLVVMIHTSPFREVSPMMNFLFGRILTKIAVPFFFVISGYFYSKKLFDNQKLFKKYILSLIEIYAIWSVIYLLIDFINWGHTNVLGFIKESVVLFFTIGSHYHLWFFPALIISICILTMLYKVGLKKMIIPIGIVSYAIGCLGNSYYSIGKNIPILGNLFQIEAFYSIGKIIYMGLPFVACGYAINLLMEKPVYERILEHIKSLCVFGHIIWTIECLIIHWAGLDKNMEITVCTLVCTIFVIMLLLKHPGERFKNISKLCYTMANFTYYAHPLFIMLYLNCININNALLEYIMVILGTSLTGFVIYKMDNRYLNKLIR